MPGDSGSSGSDMSCPSRSNSSPLTIGSRGAATSRFGGSIRNSQRRVKNKELTVDRVRLDPRAMVDLLDLDWVMVRTAKKAVKNQKFMPLRMRLTGCALIWLEVASVVSIDYVHDFALSSDGLNEASKQVKRCSHSLEVGYLFAMSSVRIMNEIWVNQTDWVGTKRGLRARREDGGGCSVT